MRAKGIFGAAVKVVISGVVMIYLALHTINFFKYTFPADQWYYAFLGFGLTGLGMVGYLILFLWDAHTPLKKVISLTMTVVCGLGEIIVAVFGMRIEAWARNGWTMTETDFDSMMLAIQVLAFAHMVALLLYYAGDKIAVMFSSDADGDGVADFMDKTDNRTGQPFKRENGRAYAKDVEHTQADPTQRQR